jgi:hypothetical protein
MPPLARISVSYGIISFPLSRITVLVEVSTDVTVCFRVSTKVDSTEIMEDPPCQSGASCRI